MGMEASANTLYLFKTRKEIIRVAQVQVIWLFENSLGPLNTLKKNK